MIGLLTALALVPVAGADVQLRGLEGGPHGRFGSTENTVANVGDVNGDGIADVAIAAPSADGQGRPDAGAVHVVFGGAALGKLDVAEAPGLHILGPRQGRHRPIPRFASDGPPEGAMAGTAVAGAGDVNGDGLADVIVGAPFSGNRGRAFSGSAYVVFGRRGAATIDLQRPGMRGFRIDGPHAESASGVSVAGPGDVDGDGRADVVVGGGISRRGTVYVVRGKHGVAAVDLRRLGTKGFAIAVGTRSSDPATTVSGAGDFNGDGLADIAVSAPQYVADGRPDGAGYAAVIFGGKHRGTIDARKLGARGLRIFGEHRFSNFGEAIAPLGDINGDGRGDLLAGASQVTEGERDYAGAAYVIFGRASGDVDLRTPGDAAYRILGPRAGEDGQARAGSAVAAVPDVNGDGRTDLLIGAPGAGRTCSPEEGAAFVVFTPPTPTPLDLDDLGANGYAITGALGTAGVGSGVASAGDWNGDGRGDALVLHDPFPADEKPRAPRADVVLGRVPAVAAAVDPTQLPTVAVPRPSVRELSRGRGLELTVTLPIASAGDVVLAEVRTSAFGEPSPIALGYAPATAPGTRTLYAKLPPELRPALRRRTKLPVEILISQCTRDGRALETRTLVPLGR